jgi:hypothetical protein
MDITLKDLQLKKLYVIFPGDRSYALSDRILVLPLAKINMFDKLYDL